MRWTKSAVYDLMHKSVVSVLIAFAGGGTVYYGYQTGYFLLG